MTLVSFLIVALVCSADWHAQALSPMVDGRVLIHEAVIDRPVGEVWWSCSTAQGAREWMAPRLAMDFRVGGEIRSSYNEASTLDDEHTIVNRILSYAPERMLAIQNVQAPAGFPHAKLFQQTWTVITLRPIDENRTEVRVAGINFGEGPEWDMLYEFFDRGNRQILDALRDLPAAPADRGVPDEENGDAPSSQRETPSPMDSIECEVIVNAKPEHVWRAWTTSEGLREFLAADSNVELNIGGAYELYFDPSAEAGQRGSEGCRILAFETHRMLSFSWNAPPHLPEARKHSTWVVLQFHPQSDSSMQVRLTHHGFKELGQTHPSHADEFTQTQAYFARVWPHVLEKLKAELESAQQ